VAFNPRSNKEHAMKHLSRIALCLALLAPGVAIAADLPITKAAPAQPYQFTGYPYGSNGPVVALYTEAGAGPVNGSVAGVNSASLTTTTAGIGVMAGYAWGSKTSMLAYSIEGKVSANNFNGANQGFSVSGPVSAEGTAYVWMPVSLIQNVFSTLSIPNPFSTIAPFPLNPANVTASNLQAGFGAGFRADDVTIAYLGVGSNKVWRFSPKIEAALMEQLSNGSAVREYVEAVFQQNGALFGSQQSKAVLGTKVMAGVMVAF
jgi:hypothetical protein